MACILSGIFGPDPVSGRIALCRARTGQILRRWGDSGKPSSSWEQLAFSPDNRLLATSDGDVIHLWETITGKEVQTFRGHRGDIESLTFSANGRRLASASWDSTVLLWGLTACAPGEQEGAKDPGEKEITSWWHDLGGNDARRAQAAVWRLVEVPTAALPFLRRHLKPVTEDEIKKAHQQIEALDHDSFAVREKASEELSKLGVTIAPLLKEALQKNPSPEVRRRLEQLLENHSDLPGSGEPLRFWRALAVLEHAGTPEAKALLQTLAGGAPQAWQTQEARAVLQRIGVGSGASQGR
jgi:hypothetical protein